MISDPITEMTSTRPSHELQAHADDGVTPAEDSNSTRQRWALLVGINRYIDPSYPDLNFCVNDVKALENALRRLGYTVVALHDDAEEERLLPTRDNVEAEFSALCEAVQPDDMFFVHFACHGVLVEGHPHLITREIRSRTMARNALSLSDIETQMRDSGAKQMVLTLDACHTGVEMGRDLTDPDFIRNVHEMAEGFALIAASTAQQRAMEWHEKEHGVFTYYMLEGLQGQADLDGKGFVTIDDLKRFVLDKLRRWNISQGLHQEPTARTEGMGDMILADFRGNESAVISHSMAPNPFGLTGRITDPEQFFGREDLQRQIMEELGKGVNLSLVGQGQVGKSSLLSMVCHYAPQMLDPPPDAVIYLTLEGLYDDDDFYYAFCDSLNLPEKLGGYRLTRALQGQRIIVCLDELELLPQGHFSSQIKIHLRGLADGQDSALKLVTASRSTLTELIPEDPTLSSPLYGIFRQIDVRNFTPNIVKDFIQHRLQNTGVSFTEVQISDLLADTDGHPAKLQRAAADLYNKLTQTS